MRPCVLPLTSRAANSRMLRQSRPRLPQDFEEGQMNLKNRIAVVTGAASGIGRETAIELAKKGCTCVLVDVREDSLAEALERVREHRPASTAEVCDVSDEARVQQMVEEIHRRYERIDVLVNNAGMMMVKFFDRMSEEEFRRHMNVNFYAPVHLMRAVVPIMQSAGSGVIINVASVGGRLVVPGTGAYAASKAALHAFSESLHYELKDKGIHVGVVVPGGTRTGIFDASIDRLGQYYRRGSTAPPMKIARAIRQAIEKERLLITVPFQYRIIIWAHDTFPGLFSRMLLRMLRPYFE